MNSGLLNLNKPSGVTSRRVVDQVQRLVRPAKAGHAGTLDPLASGVLVVCVGSATRLIEYVQRMPKRYVGTFLLGRSSNTEDIEGNVVELADAPQPTLEQVAAAAERFVGRIEQRPPAFSALKVGGRRAYELARAGRDVDLAPRTIEVYRLAVVQYEYPELVLEVECGGGTYVRSLGRDLARSLGTDAVMSALVRAAIGDFRIEDAHDPNRLAPDTLAAWLLPPRAAVGDLPVVALSVDEARRVRQGLAIPGRDLPAADQLAAVDSSGGLVAILALRADGALWPVRNFPAEA